MNNNDLLNNAIILATQAHKGQVDKAGVNYILHPLRVMLKCKTLEEKIVAILHDTKEDTYVTDKDLLASGFDSEIIDAVDAITRRDNENYFNFIGRCKQNYIARIVKLADLEDNMDLTRISNYTKKDIDRLKKYAKARKMILED
ncbi:GTP pyrophosphokinase [Clostridium sp.]|jgi:(p)ppGpp synthase/HD superfamily hydrolase|uniref:GTP pyrophosphokinase n=1 Tax=Clostridium sp. TaxID=1506 RepID=UPI00258DDCB4|nr:GTP pyrophosphokinase [Clostridium sp.]MDF2503868.1 hypothetical protein [Clostridium sp.]